MPDARFALIRTRRSVLAGLCAWVLALSMALPHSAVGQAPDVPVPAGVQFALLTRILGFDRNVPGRSTDDLVIAVAYQSNHVASRALMEEFRAAATEAGEIAVAGRRVRVVAIDIGDGDRLIESLARERANVVYMTPLRGVNVNTLARAATEAGVLSVTGVPDYMRRAVCVGFEERGGKPKIVINLDESRAAGSEFAAQLLQRAEVLRK
jgi:hypothetical protein